MSCSNATKTRNQLKFAGVPQTGQPISAASRPKFTIFWGHVEDILLLNKFFSDCRYVPWLRRYSLAKLCDGAQMAIFGDFCVLSSGFRRVQTGISDWSRAAQAPPPCLTLGFDTGYSVRVSHSLLTVCRQLPPAEPSCQRKPLIGFAPNSQGRRAWSLARNVRVKGQRSRSPGTKMRCVLPSTPGSVRVVRARCKQRRAATHGTIPSLPEGDFGGLRVVYVWQKHL